MGNKKCQDKKEKSKQPKKDHQYSCSKCGASSKKEKRLCKPRSLKSE